MSLNLFSLGTDLISHLHPQVLKETAVRVVSLVRLRFFGWFVVAVFLTLLIRLLSLSFPKDLSLSFFSISSDGWTQGFISRSDILDRSGDILATNVPIYHLAFRPEMIQDKDQFYSAVSGVFPELSLSKIEKDVQQGKKYIYIKKRISERERLAVLALKNPAFEIEKIDHRFYPKKNIYSHLVGFTDTDNKGLKGIEYGLDLAIRKTPGQSFSLSCDSRFQEAIYTSLKSGLDRYRAAGGGAILIKSDTGEVLSLVSFPDFDPNEVGRSPVDNRFNKMLNGVYEPGSVFKLFNTAIALEKGGLEEKKYNVHVPLKVGGFTINDDHKLDEKYAKMDEILIHSSNIGSAQIAWDIGSEMQKSYLKKFGFFKRLETDIGKTANPLLPAKLDKTESATLSYGHGISITPLQVVLGINALVNGGYYLTPQFLPVNQNTVKAESVISEKTSIKMRELMYRVVEEGTGQKVKVAGLKIGGKTGTSEKNIKGQYESDRLVTWFVSAFPIDSPEYTLLVMLDEPKGREEDFRLKTAAWNVVPVSREIIESILPFLDIPLDKKTIQAGK